MKKVKILLVGLTVIGVFLLVYYPHYHYPFPSHIDEWHHITEAIKLQKGEYSGGFKGFRIGFHIILLLLSKIANLVLIYRFLPAIWAGFSVLVLFYVIYRKTSGQFYPALWAMLFFASIKSNVNITGLWFFNSLTFSIPFIYLYIYFFTEGIEKENNRFILASLAIMVMLVPVHSISVLFALPFLFLYSLSNFKYIVKKWKFFSGFLIIPLMGMVFYKFMTKVPWGSLTQALICAMQFRCYFRFQKQSKKIFSLWPLANYCINLNNLL
jgi:hypothetical protein